MEHLWTKHVLHRMHVAERHAAHHTADHFLHDKRFWQIVHMLAFLAVLLLFAFWSAVNAY